MSQESWGVKLGPHKAWKLQKISNRRKKEHVNGDMDPNLWQACTHVRVEKEHQWWSGCSLSLQGIRGLWGMFQALWAHIGLETRCQAPKRAESGAGELVREQAGQRRSCCLSVSFACWRLLASVKHNLVLISHGHVWTLCGHTPGHKSHVTDKTKTRRNIAKALKSYSLKSWFATLHQGDCAQTIELFCASAFSDTKWDNDSTVLKWLLWRCNTIMPIKCLVRCLAYHTSWVLSINYYSLEN